MEEAEGSVVADQSQILAWAARLRIPARASEPAQYRRDGSAWPGHQTLLSTTINGDGPFTVQLELRIPAAVGGVVRGAPLEASGAVARSGAAATWPPAKFVVGAQRGDRAMPQQRRTDQLDARRQGPSGGGAASGGDERSKVEAPPTMRRPKLARDQPDSNRPAVVHRATHHRPLCYNHLASASGRDAPPTDRPTDRALRRSDTYVLPEKSDHSAVDVSGRPPRRSRKCRVPRTTRTRSPHTERSGLRTRHDGP